MSASRGEFGLGFEVNELQRLEQIVDDLLHGSHRRFEYAQPLVLDLVVEASEFRLASDESWCYANSGVGESALEGARLENVLFKLARHVVRVAIWPPRYKSPLFRVMDGPKACRFL